MNAKQIIVVGLGLGIATGLGYHFLTRPVQPVASEAKDNLKPLASFDLEPMELPQKPVATTSVSTAPTMNPEDDLEKSQLEMVADSDTSTLDTDESEFSYPALEDPAEALTLDAQMTLDESLEDDLAADIELDAPLTNTDLELDAVPLEIGNTDANSSGLNAMQVSNEAPAREESDLSFAVDAPAQVETPMQPVVIRGATTDSDVPQKHVWKGNPFIGTAEGSSYQTDKQEPVAQPIQDFETAIRPDVTAPITEQAQPLAMDSGNADANYSILDNSLAVGSTVDAESSQGAVVSLNDPRRDLRTPARDLPGNVGQMPESTQRIPLPEAAAQKAVHHIEYGKELSRRGAGYSAREEFLKAVQIIATANDRYANSNTHSRALRSAMIIMNEAEDFIVGSAEQQIQMDLAEVVSAHQCRLLSAEDAVGMTPAQAIDHYFYEAQQRLDKAGGRNPVTAEVFYCLGKLHSVFANNKTVPGPLDTARSVVFHQSALVSDPNHHRAANELGVLFAKNGRLEQSKILFKRSLKIQPHAQTWRNLATAHRRLGEVELAARANNELQLLVNGPAVSGSIDWIPVDQFNAEVQVPATERIASLPPGAAPKATNDQLQPESKNRKTFSQRLKELF